MPDRPRHRRRPPARRGQVPLWAAGVLALVAAVAVAIWTWRDTRPSTPGGRTEIVVWNLGLLGPEIELVLREFELEHPQYRVVHSASVAPNTTADGQRLMTAIAGGVPPDLMAFDRFAIAEWAARGALTDLTPMLAAQRPDDPYRIEPRDYYPFTLHEGSYRPPGDAGPAKLYGVPMTVDCRLLFSNADHLRQAGFVDPATGAPRPPRTWEELRDLANRLTTRDARTGGIARLGFAPNIGNSWLYMYAWQAGGELLSADGRRVTFDTPEVRRALRFMVDLYDDLGGAARVNAFQASVQTGALDPFTNGRVSVKIDSTWALLQMINWRPDMDFLCTPAPIPADRLAAGAEPITWAGGFSLIIPAGSRQGEGAFKLMQFLSSRHAYRFLQQATRESMAAEGRLFLPEPHPNRAIFEEATREWVFDAPRVPPRIKQAYETIRAMLPTAKVRPPSPVGQVVWNQHARAMDLATNRAYAARSADKDDEVRRVLADMGGEAQAQLDAFLAPPPPRLVRWTPYFVGYGALVGAFAVGGYVAQRRGRRTRGYRGRETLAAMMFASPWLLGMICLTGGPILFSVVTSFTRYDVLSPARYVGLDNYRAVLDDPVFYKSLGNTAYMVLRLPLVMALGLAIAMLLNRPARGLGAYRTAFFLPSIVPAVAGALLWILLLNPSYGAINAAIGWLFETPPARAIESLVRFATGSEAFRLSPPNWLQDPAWSKPSLILMSLWAAGGGMIIWLAGLQSIPRQLYEAAEIDGASAWGRFRNVTLPMLSPYILFNAIVGLIGTMQIFAEAYIMTSGGPADSTLFYAYYLFRNAFQYFRMGHASALAWVLFLIVLALTLVQLWASRRWVHYDRA